MESPSTININLKCFVNLELKGNNLLSQGLVQRWFLGAPPYMDQNDPKFAMTVSFRAENREKNRYIDIMPYDWSRYRFRSDSTAPHGGYFEKLGGLFKQFITGSEQTQDEEYINANYVNMNEDSRQWIAAQGPLPQTLTHFWRMIYER